MGHSRRAPAAVAAALTVTALALTACSTAQDVSGPPTTSPTTGVPPKTSATQPTTPTNSSDSGTGTPPSDPRYPFPHDAGPPGQGLARFYHQQVHWSSCEGSDLCASISVPLDYAQPDGPAIRVQARQRPAADPGATSGTLFINPGGPGASGIDYLGFVPFDTSITTAYAVVGFDPRGVGQSTPVQCVSDPMLDAFVAADPSPDTPAEIATLQRQWNSFTAGCQRLSGQLLAHVSTIEAARDMDILRAVMGDDTLNYYGASYGTYLGATYAALFPDRVGRMVLDGALDPEASAHVLALGQTTGFQGAFTAYLQDCVASGNCPLGSTVDVAQQQVIDLFKQIDAQPLATSDGRPLTEGLAFLGFVLPLYSRDNWPVETQALEQALEGNGDTLLLISDQYTDRGPDGSYTTNALEVQSAINCLDHPEHETLTEIEAGSREFVAASPVFGPVATWFPYACSYWPLQPTLPPPDFSAPGAPPIVVVGTTGDPATPYDEAVRLSQELNSGILLTRVGDGHTALASGNACIVSALDRFFTTGTPPAAGTRC